MESKVDFVFGVNTASKQSVETRDRGNIYVLTARDVAFQHRALLFVFCTEGIKSDGSEQLTINLSITS